MGSEMCIRDRLDTVPCSVFAFDDSVPKSWPLPIVDMLMNSILVTADGVNPPENIPLIGELTEFVKDCFASNISDPLSTKFPVVAIVTKLMVFI